MLKWKRGDIREALSRLKLPALAVVAIIALVGLLSLGRGLLAVVAPAIGMGLATWLIGGSLAMLAYRVRLGLSPYETTVRLARTTPLAFYGLVLAHAGMGVTVAGVTGMSAWATEAVRQLQPGTTFEHAGYVVRFRDVQVVAGPNYESQQATFDVSLRGRSLTTLVSERRFYPVREQMTTLAGIRTNMISNIYITIGEPAGDGSFPVRFYYHPLVPWIWLGFLIMALGGFVSLADRTIARRLAAIGAQAGDDFLTRAHRASGIGVAITCPDRPPH